MDNIELGHRLFPIAAFSGSLIEYSLPEAIKIAADLGFDGIEIACRAPHLSLDMPHEEVKSLGMQARELGLTIPALAGYVGYFSTLNDEECEAALKEVRKLVQIASLLSVPYVRVFPGGPNAFKAEDVHYERAAGYLRECVEEAAAEGVQILLEIHNQTLTEDASSALKLAALTGDERLGFIHDAGNMYISDVNYGAESVLQLGSYLHHVHVKDERRIAEAGEEGTFVNQTRHGNEAFMQCRLGEGEVDHLPLLAALQKSGYSGWVTLECAAPFPAVDRLAYDLRAIQRLMAELQDRLTLD
ncbi:sugar phosphate isomerase/epimerase [Neobacillus mesonae]|nr:sugar phosphate isomerase/epimerase [Neobacillus mesonae]